MYAATAGYLKISFLFVSVPFLIVTTQAWLVTEKPGREEKERKLR